MHKIYMALNANGERYYYHDTKFAEYVREANLLSRGSRSCATKLFLRFIANFMYCNGFAVLYVIRYSDSLVERELICSRRPSVVWKF